MAKHVAEGAPWPVFFYGQAYMGSLEPIISGLLCKIFGVSGFWINFSTAFFSMLTLPIVYFWARDIGGHTAARIALLLVIVGTTPFFHYNVSPRGGYALTLLTGTFVLWLGSRIARKGVQQKFASLTLPLLLGLWGGVGWWTNQLVVAALIAAALGLVLALKLRAFSWKILVPGIVGFFLGSAPFWHFNIIHGWPTFSFASSFQDGSFSAGLENFFLRLPHLFALHGQDQNILIFLGILLAVLFCIPVCFCWKKQDPDISSHVSILFLYLFFLFFLLLFSMSTFSEVTSPRYLLPIIPPLAVLMGVSLALLAQYMSRPLSIAIILLFLACPAAQALPWAWEINKYEQAKQNHIEELGAFLVHKSIEHAYARIHRRYYNYALDEKVLFSTLENNVYAPHAQQVEMSKHIAILDNYAGIEAVQGALGGMVLKKNIQGIPAYYGMISPQFGLQTIPLNSKTQILDQNGRDVASLVSNADKELAWRSRPHALDDWIEIEFHDPITVAGFRLVARRQREYPAVWALEGKTLEGEWQVLAHSPQYLQYYWSGQRLYWGGPFFRIQSVFQPQRLTHLRFRGVPTDIGQVWSISHIQVFGPGEQTEPEQDTLIPLIKVLQEKQINRLYSDRWVANALHGEMAAKIWTALDPSIFPQHWPTSIYNFLLDKNTGILVRHEDRELTRYVLDTMTLPVEETFVGPWTLFRVVAEDPASVISHNYCWAGFSILLDSPQQ